MIYETLPIKNATQVMYSEDEKSVFVSNTSGEIFLISKDINTIVKKSSYLYEPFNNNLFCLFNIFYYADKNGKLNKIFMNAPIKDINIPNLSIANITKVFDKLFVVEGKKYDKQGFVLLYLIVENTMVLKEKIIFPTNYIFELLKLSFCETKVVISIEKLIDNVPIKKWLVIDLKTYRSYELGLQYSYSLFNKLFEVQDSLIDWQFDFNRNLALFLTFDTIFLIDLLTNKIINKKEMKVNTRCHKMEWISANNVLIATSDGVFLWDFRT